MKKNVIPLLISIFLLVFSFAIDVLFDYSLNNKHYFGAVLIALATFFFFRNSRIYIYVFSLTIILGLFNAIDLLFISLKISFGGENFQVGINPLFILLAIIFMSTNKRTFKELFPQKKGSAVSAEKSKTATEKEVRMFEAKFKAKNQSELIAIADENSGYIEAAKIASRNLLNTKYRR